MTSVSGHDPRSGHQPTTFRGHIRSTIVLGAPLVGAQLAQMLVGVTDTVMVARLGTTELAAGTLAFQTFFIFLIIAIGFGAAMMPLISSALGRDDPRAVRRATRMGLWALLALSLVSMLPLWFTGDILLALGQQPELAALAQDYMRIAQWSLIPVFIAFGLRAFLTAIEHANTVLGFVLFTAVLNVVFNYAFIFGNLGAPRLEIEGAAVATLLANTVSMAATLIYTMRLPAARQYDLFVRIWRPDLRALRDVFRLGVPISLTVLAEAGLFTAASIMIGWLGTLPLAAHGIALQVASVAFMVPLGLAQASSVRVARASGRGATRDIGLAGNAVYTLAIGFSVISALVMIFFPDELVRLFLEDDAADVRAVVAIAVPLLWMAAAFQLVDGMQAVAAGNLRGLQDTRVPLIIATVAYWPVGLSVAYVLAFPLGFGALGVWGGLAAGLGVAMVLLTWRFAHRERLGLLNGT